MLRLVVVEDEGALREEMVTQLRHAGLEAVGVPDGVGLFRHLLSASCDVVVLDACLPGTDGFTIATRLKESSPVGIVLLGVDGTLEERIRSFQAGADLYFLKPVDHRELIAAALSLGRRIEPLRGTLSAQASPDLTGEAWVLDSVKWELLTPGGKLLRLTASEYRFLACLMETPGTPAARHDIIHALGYDNAGYDPRSLDAVVRRLRRKSELKLNDTLPVRAAHAQGYVFTAPTRWR
jgi:DNA-binding response OmpR family regulator